jgi:hypothetical protein
VIGVVCLAYGKECMVFYLAYLRSGLLSLREKCDTMRLTPRCVSLRRAGIDRVVYMIGQMTMKLRFPLLGTSIMSQPTLQTHMPTCRNLLERACPSTKPHPQRTESTQPTTHQSIF